MHVRNTLAKLGAMAGQPPDVVERATAQKQGPASTPGSYPDVVERAVAQKQGRAPTPGSYPDVVERAVAQKLGSESALGSYPDVLERAVAARETGNALPAPVRATGSGRELEWPQIGIRFGVGIVLMLGLWLALRLLRGRPLAHG
jgi:hypothetical protein